LSHYALVVEANLLPHKNKYLRRTRAVNRRLAGGQARTPESLNRTWSRQYSSHMPRVPQINPSWQRAVYFIPTHTFRMKEELRRADSSALFLYFPSVLSFFHSLA